jgi:hypothetical protein
MAVPAGHTISSTRSSMVNPGRPSASAAIGGAIGTGYQRWGAHTASGVSSVARARRTASLTIGSSSGS